MSRCLVGRWIHGSGSAWIEASFSVVGSGLSHPGPPNEWEEAEAKGQKRKLLGTLTFKVGQRRESRKRRYSLLAELKRGRLCSCTLLCLSFLFFWLINKEKKRSNRSEESTWDGKGRMSQGPNQSFSGCETKPISGQKFPTSFQGTGEIRCEVAWQTMRKSY